MVQQTIKDVNQSLVDDFLVQSDKIGSANFFWSFPSKAYQDQVTLRDQLQGNIKQSSESIAQMKSQIATIQQNRNSKDRGANMTKLEALRAQEATLNNSLELLKCNDPEEIKRVKKQLQYNLEQANRWTDSVWTIKSFLTKKKGMSGKDVGYTILNTLCIIHLINVRLTRCLVSTVLSIHWKMTSPCTSPVPRSRRSKRAAAVVALVDRFGVLANSRGVIGSLPEVFIVYFLVC